MSTTITKPLFGTMEYYLPFSGHHQFDIERMPESIQELSAALREKAQSKYLFIEQQQAEASKKRKSKAKDRMLWDIQRWTRFAEKIEAAAEDPQAIFDMAKERFDAGYSSCRLTF